MPVPPCGNYGDINDDGDVNMIDVMMVQDHVADPIAHPFTDEQKRRADVNGDGKVNILDQTLIFDYVAGAITTFPVCGVTPPAEITCSSPTPHHTSGCALLLYYDGRNGNDGIIGNSEKANAGTDLTNGVITQEEYDFIISAGNAGSINAVCPGCFVGTVCTPGARRCRDGNTIERCRADGSGWDVITTCGAGYECKDGICVEIPTPPNTETRTVSLTEGSHTIQVSFTGYDTLNATINVSSTGVTCVVGPCNTQGPPGVTTSGWTVTTYLKTASVVSDVCSWINSIGGWRNLQWTSHVLEAYYVYIGAAGHSVGFSPVTWNDVLGLYYYYINDPTAGNGKIGCGT